MKNFVDLLHELAIGNVFGIGRPLQVGESPFPFSPADHLFPP